MFIVTSESWALSDVLFLRLPRKSEIATGLDRRKGRKEERERKEWGVRGKEGKQEGGLGGQETDDQALLLVHPLLPFPPAPKSYSLLLCLLSSVLLLTSSLSPLPPSLRYFETLDCFPAWLVIGWLAVCHRNQRFKTILRTFYPNPVPPHGVPWRSRDWRGGEGGLWGRQTKYCWLSGVSTWAQLLQPYALHILSLIAMGIPLFGVVSPCKKKKSWS